MKKNKKGKGSVSTQSAKPKRRIKGSVSTQSAKPKRRIKGSVSTQSAKPKRRIKGSVSTQSAKPKRRKSRLILTFLLIALIILFVLIFISFKTWNLLEKKKVQKIEIIDGCSYFMGSILHQVRDLPDCQNSCRSECYILDKNFVEVEFEGFEEGCNTCICYCK